MLCGAGFYSFTIGSLSTVLANMDTRQQNLNQKTIYMNTFAKDAKIPYDLRERLRKALEYTSNKQCFSWNEKKRMFISLPIHLRVEVANSLHRGALKQIHFFENKSEIFIYSIAIQLIPVHMNEGEIIYQELDYPGQIYFLTSGRINYVQESYIYKSLNHGTYFGEIEIFLQIPRANTIQVDQQSDADLLAFEKEDFLNVLDRFPDIRLEMVQIAEKRKLRNQLAKQELEELLYFFKNAEKQSKQFALQNLVGKNRALKSLTKLASLKKYQRQAFKDLKSKEFEEDEQEEKIEMTTQLKLDESEDLNTETQESIIEHNDTIECQSAFQFNQSQKGTFFPRKFKMLSNNQERCFSIEMDNDEQLNDTFDSSRNEEKKPILDQKKEETQILKDTKKKKQRLNSEPDFVIKKFLQQNGKQKKSRFDFDIIESKTTKKRKLKEETKKETKKANVIFRVAMEQILLNDPKNNAFQNDIPNPPKTDRSKSQQIKRDWTKIALMRNKNRFFGKDLSKDVSQSNQKHPHRSMNAQQLGKFFTHQLSLRQINTGDKSLLGSSLKDLQIENSFTENKLNENGFDKKLIEYNESLNQTIKKQNIDVMKQQMEGLFFLLKQQKKTERESETNLIDTNQSSFYFNEKSHNRLQFSESSQTPKVDQKKEKVEVQIHDSQETIENSGESAQKYKQAECMSNRSNSTQKTEENIPPLSLKSKFR